MADIGKPLRRYKVIPLTEPVVPTHEPQRVSPTPNAPGGVPVSPQKVPAEPERVALGRAATVAIPPTARSRPRRASLRLAAPRVPERV